MNTQGTEVPTNRQIDGQALRDPEPSPHHDPLSVIDARRSGKNIAVWNKYLPTDCVRAMVRMGWDYTT